MTGPTGIASGCPSTDAAIPMTDRSSPLLPRIRPAGLANQVTRRQINGSSVTSPRQRSAWWPEVIPEDLESTDSNIAISLGIPAIATGAVMSSKQHQLDEHADATRIVPGSESRAASNAHRQTSCSARAVGLRRGADSRRVRGAWSGFGLRKKRCIAADGAKSCKKAAHRSP